MTYRYPKRLAYLEFSIALVMMLALYINTKPMLWGWLLFSPLFLFIVFQAVRAYRFSITIDGDLISVADIKRSKYLVSEITAINVWIAKGERIAVIAFSDRRKLSFPSHLEGFNDLIEFLRKQTRLAEPISNTDFNLSSSY